MTTIQAGAAHAQNDAEQVQEFLKSVLGEAYDNVMQHCLPQELPDLSFDDYFGYEVAVAKLTSAVESFRRQAQFQSSVSLGTNPNGDTWVAVRDIIGRWERASYQKNMQELLAYCISNGARMNHGDLTRMGSKQISDRAEVLDNHSKKAAGHILELVLPVLMLKSKQEQYQNAGGEQRLLRHLEKSRADIFDQDYVRLAPVMNLMQQRDPNCKKLTAAVAALTGKSVEQALAACTAPSIQGCSVSSEVFSGDISVNRISTWFQINVTHEGVKFYRVQNDHVETRDMDYDGGNGTTAVECTEEVMQILSVLLKEGE